MGLLRAACARRLALRAPSVLGMTLQITADRAHLNSGPISGHKTRADQKLGTSGPQAQRSERKARERRESSALGARVEC